MMNTINNNTMNADYQAIVVNCSPAKWRAESLQALPVPALSARNAAVFFWCPSSCTRQALQLLRRWGFEYHDVLRTHVALDGTNGGLRLQRYLPQLVVGVRGKVLDRCTQPRARPYVCQQDGPVTLQQTMRAVESFLDVPRCVVVGAEKPLGSWDAWCPQHGLLLAD